MVSRVLQIQLNEPYLNMVNCTNPTKELISRLKFCNLVFQYNKIFKRESLDSALIKTTVTDVGHHNDIFDFCILTEILENSNRKVSKELENMLTPIGNIIFSEVFTPFQREKYFGTKQIPYLSSLKAITKCIKPFGLILNDPDDKYSPSSNYTTYSTLTHGHAKHFKGLSVPIDLTYNFKFLTEWDTIGTNLPLFFCIGPGTELTCGYNLGLSGLYSNNQAAPAINTLKKRKINGKEICDQKLTSCFWIGKQGETKYNVAKQLAKICISNTQSDVMFNCYKEVGVIRIGNILFNGLNNNVTIKNDKYAIIHSFFFTGQDSWEIQDFFYKEKKGSLTYIITTEDYSNPKRRKLDTTSLKETNIERNKNALLKNLGAASADITMPPGMFMDGNESEEDKTLDDDDDNDNDDDREPRQQGREQESDVDDQQEPNRSGQQEGEQEFDNLFNKTEGGGPNRNNTARPSWQTT